MTLIRSLTALFHFNLIFRVFKLHVHQQIKITCSLIFSLFYKKLLATVPPPPTTTQPIPTYSPSQLPYKATADYVWSNFNNNATSIIECASSHEALPFDPKCKPWGGTRCNDKKTECLGNGPLGMGTSVILRNDSSAKSKVNLICIFIGYRSMCNCKFF